MKNILVIQLFRFGDVLQSTAAVSALRYARPDARICVLVRKAFSAALRGNEDVDEVIEWDLDGLAAHLADPGRPLAKDYTQLLNFVVGLRQRGFDAVYNLANDMVSALLVALLDPEVCVGLRYGKDGVARVEGFSPGGRAPARVSQSTWTGYLFLAPQNRSLNSFNLVDIFLGTCGFSGSDSGYRRLMMAVTEDDRRHADELLRAEGVSARELTDRGLIAIQPGASKIRKRWPAWNYSALAHRLWQSTGSRIVIVGAGGEKEWAEHIHAAAPKATIDLAGRTSFGQLGAVLRCCRLLVGNDTATAHVAAAVGTPVLVLSFGTTSGHETGPYGEGHYVLEPVIDCFPCNWQAECTNMRCRDALTVDRVAAAAQHALAPDLPPAPCLRDGQTILYRSFFRPDGMLDLRPVNRPGLDTRVLLREAWRHYWTARLNRRTEPFVAKASLAGLMLDYAVPDDGEPAAALESLADDFGTLNRLARCGLRATRQLTAPGEEIVADDQLRSRLAATLGRIEAEMAAAEKNPALRFFAGVFKQAQREMPHAPLPVCARSCAEVYGGIAAGAEFMERAMRAYAGLLGGAAGGGVPAAVCGNAQHGYD